MAACAWCLKPADAELLGTTVMGGETVIVSACQGHARWCVTGHHAPLGTHNPFGRPPIVVELVEGLDLRELRQAGVVTVIEPSRALTG